MEGNSHRAYFTGCLRFALGMTFYPKECIFFFTCFNFIFEEKKAQTINDNEIVPLLSNFLISQAVM